MSSNASWIRKIYGQLRYYYKIPNPEDLPEEEVLMLFSELQWVRTQEKKERPTLQL